MPQLPGRLYVLCEQGSLLLTLIPPQNSACSSQIHQLEYADKLLPHSAFFSEQAEHFGKIVLNVARVLFVMLFLTTM